MHTYYYIIALIALAIIITLIRSVKLQRKNTPVRLFVEALRNENDGHFEAAVITYETALEEVKKIRFHGGLKNKIIQKLKVLHTNIDYKNSFHIIIR